MSDILESYQYWNDKLLNVVHVLDRISDKSSILYALYMDKFSKYSYKSAELFEKYYTSKHD